MWVYILYIRKHENNERIQGETITTTTKFSKVSIHHNNMASLTRLEEPDYVEMSLKYNHIYPTPPLGKDMTQGQFLSEV